MTVEKNIAYVPELLNKDDKARTRAAVEKWMKIVGLDPLMLKRFPDELSGGQQQRVGIARSLAASPDILLMDEPFGHLDAQTRYMMEAELEKIWQKEKRTVVFVTNNSEEAVYLADRIIILTNTPTHIKEEIKVDLPRPRQYSDPAFLEIRRRIEEICDDTL